MKIKCCHINSDKMLLMTNSYKPLYHNLNSRPGNSVCYMTALQLQIYDVVIDLSHATDYVLAYVPFLYVSEVPGLSLGLLILKMELG